MARGRRYCVDRLLGTYSYGGQGHAAAAAADLPDLREEDVWSAVADNYAGGPNERRPGLDRSEEDRDGRRWLAREGRRHVGGLSLAFEEGYEPRTTVVHQYRNVDAAAPPPHGRRRHHHHPPVASAPVNVPDWPRFLRVDWGESMREAGEAEADCDDGEWVPPHEYLAREQGRMAAASVFEGVGRTLKGRDMSRVRESVWSQTGFFG
ncbi:Thiamine thiazole synthase [Cocos nucifera]|uniref:Thiamine thiazole synthase n=1 Tax=Cocos nucifera TaxID=13894 RepID=A0A8K0NBY9_COCNU|nr:Thiamine thiazole synthase [Cocos nucifera]